MFKIGDKVEIYRFDNDPCSWLTDKRQIVENKVGTVLSVYYDTVAIIYADNYKIIPYSWRVRLVKGADRFSESKSRVEKRHLLKKTLTKA